MTSPLETGIFCRISVEDLSGLQLGVVAFHQQAEDPEGYDTGDDLAGRAVPAGLPFAKLSLPLQRAFLSLVEPSSPRPEAVSAPQRVWVPQPWGVRAPV